MAIAQLTIDFDAAERKAAAAKTTSTPKRKAKAAKTSPVSRAWGGEHDRLVAEVVPGESIRVHGQICYEMDRSADVLPQEWRGMIEAIDSIESILVFADYCEEHGFEWEASNLREKAEAVTNGGGRYDWTTDSVREWCVGRFGTKFEQPIYTDYDRTWKVGEEVVYDSFNLVYTGPIVKITAKRVFIAQDATGRSSKKSFDFSKFFGKNYDADMGEIHERNHETMMYI